MVEPKTEGRPPEVGWVPLAVILLGFPLLHQLAARLPFFQDLASGDRSAFVPVLVTAGGLDAAAAAAALWIASRSRWSPARVGFTLPRSRILGFAGAFLALGAGIVVYRALASPEPFGADPFLPHSTGERAWFVLSALTAGFCQETAYRGFAISALRSRGGGVVLASCIASVAWTFVHAPIGLTLVPVYLAYGAIFSALFVWRESVVPCIALHIAYDLALILIV